MWEAEPTRFAARYPDSRIEDSYGDQWPGASCIDYWIYVDPVTMTARVSVEGWNRADETVGLTGDGRVDGRRLASKFAHILGVALLASRDATSCHADRELDQLPMSGHLPEWVATVSP